MLSFFTGIYSTIAESSFFASFDLFGSKDYLHEYYKEIDYENDELLKFYADAYRDVEPVQSVLEFSGGPTVYSLITAATKTGYIHFSDYLKGNREEVSHWLGGHPKSFNWDMYIAKSLEYEGLAVDEEAVTIRRDLMKDKITKILACNAFETFSLSENDGQKYDIVQSNFVADSITHSREEWEKAIANIVAPVKQGGYVFLTSLKNSVYYVIDDKKFPAVPIFEKDIVEILDKHGFDMENAFMRSIVAHPYRGYEGMIFVRAQKSA